MTSQEAGVETRRSRFPVASETGPNGRKPTRRWAKFLRLLFSDLPAGIGAAILLLIVSVSVLAPVIAPYDPYVIRPELRLVAPGVGGYLLGGDELGRDVLSRLLWGGRTSLVIGFAPAMIACLIGSVIGIVGGFLGGAVDSFTMRVLDVFLAFPSVLLALGIAAAIGPGVVTLVISLSVVGIPRFARLIRSTTLAIRDQEYISAAIATGGTARYVIYMHVLRNVVAPVLVAFSLEAGRTIVMGAGLSFLGLGPRPPTPEWGAMLSSGQQFMSNAPHLATIPGVMVVLLTVSVNLVGDRVRDILDPKQSTVSLGAGR